MTLMFSVGVLCSLSCSENGSRFVSKGMVSNG